jgi:hypothetical protein
VPANNHRHTNPNRVIVQWTSKAGDGQLGTADADFTVFADGRVKVAPRLTNSGLVEGQLSEAERSALRHFIFEEQDIWSIDSEVLEQAVKRAARSQADADSDANTAIPLKTEAIVDAATTIIRVSEGERGHMVSHYNLFAHAQRYPEIDALRRLRNIELHLLALAQRVADTTR